MKEKHKKTVKRGGLWVFSITVLIVSIQDFGKNPTLINGVILLPSFILVGLVIYVEKEYPVIYKKINKIVKRVLKREDG